MATRVASTRFVGRSAELAELCAALKGAGSGRPSLALVAGESGVGKTRLIGELSARARDHGGLVLSGDCVQLGEGELPYAPLISALRPLVRAGEPALDALSPVQRAELATIVPGLGPAAGDAPVDQARVFEGLLALLDVLGEQGPVLLVIEDVHWSDSSTRHFLGFLSRTICRERLLVVATYRSDELHRRHPLRPLLAELVRDPATRVVELPALTRAEVAEQLEDIVGGPPDGPLIERLHGRSGGNPLFIEELLAAGLDGRGSLPPTLRDALMLRVERLPDPAQEVLRWLACRPSDDTLLAELSGLDQPTLRDGLRAAVTNHIAVAGDDGSYSFRHALLSEVVYDDLLPGERTERHAALARALERRVEAEGEGVHLTAQVAHHWLAAGDQPAAFAASVRAAAAAERVHAFGEAFALLERALALWDRVPEPERLAGGDQVALLVQAANVADIDGDSVRHESLLHRALELLDEAQEPHRAAQVLERLARAQGNLNRQDEALVTIERGLALLPDADRSIERAALLAAGARVRMLQSRFADAAERAHAALQAARELDDGRVIEVRALNSLGVAQAGLGDFEAGAAALREALERADAKRLDAELSVSYVNLADLLNLAGRADEALAVARRGLAQVTPGTRSGDWVALCVVEMAYHAGRWEEAEGAMPDTARRRSGTLLALWRLSRSVLALGRGEVETARSELAAIERAMRGSTEVQFVSSWGWQRAEVERRSGDLDAARAAIADTLDRIELCSDDMARIASVAEAGTRVEADAAQAARDRRDPQAERRAIESAGALLARVELAAEAGGPVVGAELATARAEHARARGSEDGAVWAAAAGAWADLNRPYQAVRARLRQAEALVARGDRSAAAAVAGSALHDARELGSGWVARALESLAARARLRLEGDPRSQPRAGPGALEEQPFNLTARERQVLALVARGATNREIGAELHMAEKTASVHVSRILAKLDVRSRTEAAAVAHRQGLAGDAAASV
jgi:DNA-binding CsgD family transcriptional regulator/tetratricopeptide (TPR) repeat protein